MKPSLNELEKLSVEEHILMGINDEDQPDRRTPSESKEGINYSYEGPVDQALSDMSSITPPSQMSVHQRQRSSSESESEDDQYRDQCGSIGSEKRSQHSSA